ncbi:hypothetical protein N7516_009031 [Penicillium verrucosum]|uniref:uncharacterized protein n=1 Tax=Penicillium verrucosum TaxID=60171 RepID=UPI0025451491|nr:uncharacterized protein N7516_009031 [Penicillium verrucosum]KAJ5927258.1 hypothetical protein N7516_009031 [Penicillium verrucosum]
MTKSDFQEHNFEKLHEKYNTQALRIGPNELHITDVNLYKVILSKSSLFPKYAPFYDGFNTPHTVFTECDPPFHKELRRLLNPRFSHVGLFKLEPIIQQNIKMLVGKIHFLAANGPVNAYDAFRLSCNLHVEEPGALWKKIRTVSAHRSWGGFNAASKRIPDLQYQPWLRKLINIIPQTLVYNLSPEIGSLLDITKLAEDSARHLQKSESRSDHPVVLERLETVNDAEKVTEAMDILIADADTTASTLTTGLIHILSDSEIERRLLNEVDLLPPDENGQLPLQTLEKSEYLNATVKETLRVGMAVPGRLPRVVSDSLTEPFIVDGKVVPPGTTVSISTYTMHTDTSIWGPDARKFRPDRWIGPQSKGLEQYLCIFPKGARMCIGQNLALAEIIIALAYILRNFKMSLRSKSDIGAKNDRFTLQYEAHGAQVTFKPRS